MRTDLIPQDFRTRLLDHLRVQIAELYPSEADVTEFPVYLQNECIYRHATARFNYTTYDVCRNQDIINPSTDKRDILVSILQTAEQSDAPSHPFAYARILGVFHAQVQHPFSETPMRIDFLWVRWLQYDPQWPSGDGAERLDCVRFVPAHSYDTDVFGFLDPMHIIRACHLMPGFSDGRVPSLLLLSRQY